MKLRIARKTARIRRVTAAEFLDWVCESVERRESGEPGKAEAGTVGVAISGPWMAQDAVLDGGTSDPGLSGLGSRHKPSGSLPERCSESLFSRGR